MLVLSRKLNQTIVIDEHIVVKVLRVENGVVRLGIQAPASVSIHRQEIFDALQKRDASTENFRPDDRSQLLEKKG